MKLEYGEIVGRLVVNMPFNNEILSFDYTSRFENIVNFYIEDK